MKRLAGIALVGLMLAGCGQGYDRRRGRGDAPVGSVDGRRADIIEFPDEFENVATKCDGHGHRIFVTTRDAAPVVVSDPVCGGPGG